MVSAGGSLMAEVLLLVAARWGAFSGFVPELTVVPTGLVRLQRVVGGAERGSLECERWRTLACGRLCVWDACSEVTWRESSSFRSRSPAVLSGVEVEVLVVVGRG